jgi:hypothetical protein
MPVCVPFVFFGMDLVSDIRLCWFPSHLVFTDNRKQEHCGQQCDPYGELTAEAHWKLEESLEAVSTPPLKPYLGVGPGFQILEIHRYVGGLKTGSAMTSGPLEGFETASNRHCLRCYRRSWRKKRK